MAALVTTLFALPVNAAITLPTEPLTTGARVPANVLFILDDSGSMGWRYMYNPDISTLSGGGITSSATGDNTSGDNNYDASSTALNAMYDQAYVTNTLYYNPWVTYVPWVDSTGTPLTGGTTYGAAYSDAISVPFTLAGTTSGTVNLASSVKTFYIPKIAGATPSDATQYYRYQILTNGKVIRSERQRAPAAGEGVSNSGCDTSKTGWGWRSCTEITPTGRTADAEKVNFATWYSYNRTRTKAAKSGAGRAFSDLGKDIRVGFRTIWGRAGNVTTGNSPTQAIPIPVGYNQGLFDDPNGVTGANNNRARWFARLYGATASSGTPLRSALDNAGKYFQQSDASGPYGPEAGADQLQCRQNFTILTTDGYWNNDSGFSSGGDQDSTDGVAIARPDGSTYTYKAAAPYKDGQSNTLADVAMRYWKNDLRTDLINIVPTSTADPAFWQHMVTFGISIGLKGSLDPKSDLPALQSGSLSWPTAKADTLTAIDDLWHASINGHGKFLAAADPDEFTRGLRDALAAVTERTGSFSNVAANSTSLNTGTRLFQGRYVSGVWSGEVSAYAVANNVVSATAAWSASQGIPTSGRKVFTSDGRTGLVFPSGVSTTQLNTLARVGTDNYPVTAAANAAYIAGTRTQEVQNGGTLRNRSTVLGDVVGSSPAYVADTNTLYVGANDGMLHAFNAGTGAELFSYIPNGINWSDLAGLSRPDYVHRFFVDGPVVVSTRVQTPAQNILVGALGKGGKGLFALDVSNPATFSERNFKWEVGGSSGNMGLVQSRPIITRMNNGSLAVIVANGLNSTNGRAVLMIYDLLTGNLIKEIDTGIGSAVADDPSSNGLMNVVGWDGDGNGTVDYIYGGDMLGNVWKFDLSASGAASWAVSGNAPLFHAEDSSGAGQPITGGLTVVMNPKTFRPWVFFGTGRLMTQGDMSSKTVQSLYGFVDDGTAVRRRGTGANLTQRQIVVSGSSNGYPVRSFQEAAALPTNSKGWYVDLLTPPNPPGTADGEKVVTDAQIYGDVLLISSVIPTATACASDGRGYLNALDAFTGTSSSSSLFDLNGNGSFDDETLGSNGKNLPIGSVDLGVGMPTLADVLRGMAAVGGSAGKLGGVPIREARTVGRVSWREILNN